MPIVSRYEVTRGRTSELDKTGTGSATITMIDTNKSLDPASGSTDYDPMKPVAIALTNPYGGASSPIFRGHISRWSYDHYPTMKYATATIECVDGMDVLAAAEMTFPAFGDTIPGDSIGNLFYEPDDQVAHRINQVLDEADWPIGLREIFSGNVSLKGTVYASSQPALNAITDAADAEFPGVANFYMQKDGRATFHGRLARFNPLDAQYHISRWKVGDMAAVAGDSSYAVITGLEYDRDKDRIINSASATPEGIADADIQGQTVQSASSIAQYGTRSWSAENLLTNGDYFGAASGKVAVKKFANYYVTNYATPRTRINRLTFSSRVNSSTVWALLCGVDISDRLEVTAGAFANQFYFVEGLHYTVEGSVAGPGTTPTLDVTLELDVSPASYYATAPS